LGGGRERGTYLGHELVGLRSRSAGRRGWGRNLLLLLLFAHIGAAAAGGGGGGGRELLLSRPVIGSGGGVAAIVRLLRLRLRLRLRFFGHALVVVAGCIHRLCSTLGTVLLSPLRSGIALRQRWRRG
jgi:hypothetical protein